MMQAEGTRMTAEDRRELEINIKHLEWCVDVPYPDDEDIKELRRLRRLRDSR